MTNYIDFYNELESIRIISPVWKLELQYIESKIKDNKDELLSLFAIYFSLISDGNLYMSLDSDILTKKWEEKLSEVRIRLKEKDDSYDGIIDNIINESKKLMPYLSKIKDLDIIGDKKLFIIESNNLYSRRYYNSRKIIIDKIKELFDSYNSKEADLATIRKYYSDKFKLEDAQEEIVKKGVYNNLLITGGPGTGKTTSIIFLLIKLLEEQGTDYDIYLTAPSGKAASRMKDSIKGTLEKALKNYKNDNSNGYEILSKLEGKTIHRLLGYNGDFKYNKNNQFSDKSIFIIDEASMIDATLFSALLEAIPKNARVFILGDKDQLPSVECGQVYGELIQSDKLKNHKVELTESKRFENGSPIYNLAQQINGKTGYVLDKKNWQDYKSFEVLENEKVNGKTVFNVNYYDDDEGKNDSEIMKKIIISWSNKYCTCLKEVCSDIEYDKDKLKEVFDHVELSKILCAENDSLRGIKKINREIVKYCYKKSDTDVCGFYPGEILMINTNDYELNLFNGEMGIVVKFKDDPMLYFMVSKKTELLVANEKLDNRIFKIEQDDVSFVFYPIHMISKKEIDLAFAISIHKSQGSDYSNILVILPSKKGHPLLNRQIVYTAITRTKGNTYILSNQDRLEEAKDKVIYRDTDIRL